MFISTYLCTPLLLESGASNTRSNFSANHKQQKILHLPYYTRFFFKRIFSTTIILYQRSMFPNHLACISLDPRQLPTSHPHADGLVHFNDPQSMDYHEWTTEMDYLNGRLNGLPYITCLEKNKKIAKVTKAWLFCVGNHMILGAIWNK